MCTAQSREALIISTNYIFVHLLDNKKCFSAFFQFTNIKEYKSDD